MAQSIGVLIFRLLLFGIGVYCVKLTSSPIYFIYAFAFLLFIFYCLSNGHVRIKNDSRIALVLAVYAIFTNIDNINGALINLVMGLLAYVILRAIQSKLNISKMLSTTLAATYFTVIVMAADTAYRLLNPTVPPPEVLAALAASDSLFYLYKFNSLMFADSNTIGLLAMQLFFLVLYLHRRVSPRSVVVLLVSLFSIICLSISRAAIIATLICITIFALRKYLLLRLRVRASTIFYFIALMLIFFPILNDFSFKINVQDMSLQSKFYIIEKFLNRLENTVPLNELLFGIGLDRSIAKGGMAAHNILVTYASELGLFGLFLFLTFLLSILRRSRPAWLYVLLPALIAGQSYYLYAGAPFLFVPLALILIFEEHFGKVQ